MGLNEETDSDTAGRMPEEQAKALLDDMASGAKDWDAMNQDERDEINRRIVESGAPTLEDIKRQQDMARATAFVSEQTGRTHVKYAHLLPTEFPSGQGKPHVCGPDIGDGCCRCEFEPLRRGGLYTSWCGQSAEDSRKAVVRILGEIDNDNGGGTWIVGRVLASDAPAYCGQMIHFAPNSITGHSMDECAEPKETP